MADIELQNLDGVIRYYKDAAARDRITTLEGKMDNVDDALFSDDTTTVDYTNVITLQNAPDVHAQSLKVKFEPIQSGSGDPSPTNVRPISGHTKANTIVAGKNLVEAVLLERGINSSGAVFISSSYDLAYCKVKKGVTYTIKTVDATNQLVYGLYTNVPTNGEISTVGRVVSDSFTYTATEDCYFAFRMDHGYATPQIEVGLTSTAYVSPQPKQTHTTPFGDTYYSGYVDVVNGELVVEGGIKTFDGSEAWSAQTSQSHYNMVLANPFGSNKDIAKTISDGISNQYDVMSSSSTWAETEGLGIDSNGIIRVYDANYNTSSSDTAWKAHLASNPLQLAYYYSDPIRIPLTPQLVKLFKGYNTIYSDAGQVRLEYTANLITCLNEDIAKKADNAALAPVEDGATAKRAYTKGQHFMRDGEFCTALASIASGASFTRGTNYKGGDVATVLNSGIAQATDILSGATVALNAVVRAENVITLALQLNSVTVNAWVTIAKLASEYRPYNNMLIPVIVGASVKVARIDTSGNIQMAEAVENQSVFINSSWIN